MRRVLCALTLLIAFPLLAQAQTGDSQATIYVYRGFYHATFGKAAPMISANGEKLAELDEGRYFVAQFPAGFLVVRSGKKKENQVEIEARAGETYYLRVRAHPGLMFARFELLRVSKDEAAKDAGKLRYVTPKDTKSSRVLKDAPKPATTEESH